LQVDDNVSEKHNVSIFRADVEMLGSGGIYKGKAEGLDQPETRNEGEGGG
jgi:hypothetical protein